MGKLQSYAMFLCQLWVSGCCSSFAVWVKRVWQVVAGRSRSCNYRSFSVNRRCAGRKPRLQAESGATSLQATFGKKSLHVFLVPWYRNFLCWLLAFLQDLCYRVELIFLGEWLDDIVQIGGSDAATFPVQKKRLSREYLRSIAHLRPRTNTFGAVCTCL